MSSRFAREWLCVLLCLLGACQAARSGPLAPAEGTAEGAAGWGLPATWTPAATPVVSSPSPLEVATWAPSTRRPTTAPWPTATPTQPPTATGTPIPDTRAPTPTPHAHSGVGGNLLPNPSFEGSWYHMFGAPELQVANGWFLEWDEGFNPLAPDPGNPFIRPESRILSRAFLPAHEHSLYIWDGDQTVKIFKGSGAISFRLLANVHLAPGSYLLEVHVFPDLVVGYKSDGTKIWAPDPLSGEVRLVVGEGGSGWILPAFGQKNRLAHFFTVSAAHTVRVGVAMRGRWAIENNGWFMDDWSLRQFID